MSVRELDKPLFVGGSWQSASGDEIDVFDPTSDTVIAAVPSASSSEVNAALGAASSAQSAWDAAGPIVRGRHLREMADLIAANADKLATLLVEEVGKPLD